MTQAEFYAKKAQEEAERRAAIHESAMREKAAEIARSPGSFNHWEKKAVNDYLAQREQERQFNESQAMQRGQWGFTDAYGIHHAGGAEKVAEYGYQGQRDAGKGAAEINLLAARYGADRTLEGIQAQAKSAEQIAREKAEAEKWIARRNAETAEEASKREWGQFDANGQFTGGGRVKQAEEQGKAAAQVAAANNQAKIEQERIKAQAKTTAAAMAKDTRIAAAIGGNPMLANNPEKAQEMLEALAGAGLSAEEAAEIIERRNKQQGGQGTGTTQQPAENARSQKIRNAYQQRGMGV